MERLPFRALLLLASCAALVASCTPTGADAAQVPTGTWAGDHVVMDVTARGATLEFDCAHGTIDAPLTLNSASRFDVAGTFTSEAGGPTRSDPSPRPARYTGSLAGTMLTVTIVLTDTNDAAGSFTLNEGAQPRLVKCK